MRKAIVLAIAIFAAAGSAAAQGGSCKNRVVVDSVYSVPADKGYEYYLQLRNTTSTALRADITFNGFVGKRVSLLHTHWKAYATKSKESPKLKFGTGSNNLITTDTVRVMYDLPPTADVPSVSVSNCR